MQKTGLLMTQLKLAYTYFVLLLFLPVSLLHGNNDNHGVLYSVQGSDYGPVCAEGFDETDAGKMVVI